MENAIDGILLIDKNEGESSYDVVRKVKSAFNARKGMKTGHAGTLDPFATGMLVILLGQGTKLSPFIMSERKVYLATVMLGVETDTLDPTGQVIRSSRISDLSPEVIEEKTRCFVGNIRQSPPIYSAVKYRGTRAYKLARKGIEFDLQTRTVTIDSLQIISVDLPEVTFKIKCSSGTYIRSLGADIARELGTCGHVKSLRRMACGSFDIESALNSNEIRAENDSKLRERVLDLRDALPVMQEIEVESLLADKIRQGYQPALADLFDSCDMIECKEGYAKIVERKSLLAIVALTGDRAAKSGKLKIERVFC
ncbi:MAG: tRNA pseudouridine(55) synthase TruB [Deltaproteobacteria bacterium]|nr:tRNA pseudouridine(55) synthase TruB [Deltaproteobacteria bacterium]